MDEMTVDVEKAGAVLFHFDQMGVPDFVVHGARCSHFYSPVFPPMRSNEGAGVKIANVIIMNG